MKEFNVFKFVFSSSCTVYGNPKVIPVTEESPTGNVISPYGRTKYITEEFLRDLSASDEVK